MSVVNPLGIFNRDEIKKQVTICPIKNTNMREQHFTLTANSIAGKANEPVLKQPTTGKRHTQSSMTCLWSNFKRELDISMGAKVYRNQIIESKVAPDLVPYCLRHTYGTDLQDAGVPLNIAKYLMGHSDIAMTANIYTHTSNAAIKSAAEKINAAQKTVKKSRVTEKTMGKLMY